MVAFFELPFMATRLGEIPNRWLSVPAGAAPGTKSEGQPPSVSSLTTSSMMIILLGLVDKLTFIDGQSEARPTLRPAVGFELRWLLLHNG